MARARSLTLFEYALLGLIRLQPQSGYDLRKACETTPLSHYSGSPGSVYPALKRLRARKLVTARVDAARRLRPREVFTLTPAGDRALRAWVSELPDRDAVISDTDALLLRFAFMSGLCKPSHVHRFLEILARESEAYAKQLEQLADTMVHEAALHGRLAVQSGAEQYRGHARWARRAARHFKKGAT